MRCRRCFRLFGIVFFIAIIWMVFIVIYPDHFRVSTSFEKNEIDNNITSGMAEASHHKRVRARFEQYEGGPIPVVILTYMRSGSSFVGEVIKTNENVFYIFEPLRKIEENFRDSRKLHYLKSWASDNYFLVIGNVIHNLLKCSFLNVPEEVWTDSFLDAYGQKTQGLKHCMEGYVKKSRKEALVLCLQELEDVCRNSSHVVIKVIRLQMFVLEKRISSLPNLKIIHLSRDPRATVSSQKRFGIYESIWEVGACDFCNRLLADILTSKRICFTYPNTIFTLFYEDIAKNPLNESQKLFHFLGLELTYQSSQQITKMTTGGESNYCGTMCTTKQNSSLAADSWRLHARLTSIYKIDMCCQQVYELLGYIPVASPSILKDIRVRLRRNPAEQILC